MKNMEMNKITYYIERHTPLKKYVMDYILFIIGLKSEDKNGAKIKKVNIYYGNSPHTIDYDIRIPERADDLVWNSVLHSGKLVDFDIVNAISALITDEVNRSRPAEAYDEHQRLKYGESFQKINDAEIPYIDAYIGAFRTVLINQLGVSPYPLWPFSKKWVVGLSHDVDYPAVINRHLYSSLPKIVVNFDGLNLFRVIVSILYQSIPFRGRHRYWLFEDIVKLEKSYGFKSTFFFASIHAYQHWGTRLDVAYDVSDEDYRRIFQILRENGFEIGLHASYNAYQQLSYFIYEKNRLEDIVGNNIKGVRHHYWHIGRDVSSTLRKHPQCGLKYDSSLAFNDYPGFRYNISFPFYPWDEDFDINIKTLQLPTSLMDGNLLSNIKDENKVWQIIQKQMATIKENGGLAVINWHARASIPGRNEYSSWGRVYRRILNFLADDPHVWVTNLSEIFEWMDQRKQVLGYSF